MFPIKPVRIKPDKKNAVDKDPGPRVPVVKKGPPKKKLDLDYLGEKSEPKKTNKYGIRDGNGDEVLAGAADGQGTKDELQKAEGQYNQGKVKDQGGQGTAEGQKGHDGVETKGKNGGGKSEEIRATNKWHSCNLSHNKVPYLLKLLVNFSVHA